MVATTVNIPLDIDAPGLAPKYNFDIKQDGGAKLDGSDDSDAIDRTIDLAINYIQEKNLGAEVFFPPGVIGHRRPIFQGNPRLAFRGAGEFTSVLSFLNGATGHNIIGAPNRTVGDGAPQYVTALGGPALKCSYSNTGSDNTFDLTTYQFVRLKNSWTIAYVAANIERLPTEGEYARFLPGTVMGQLYQGQPWYATCLAVFVQYTGQLKFQFRYGGTVLDFNVATASKTHIAPGDSIHVLIEWDNAAKVMRFYLNGELWTLGHYTPPVGDGSGFIHNGEWERMCVGSGYMFDFPNESLGQATLPYSLRAFSFSNVVRHTEASFTPNWGGDPVDGNTVLKLDFGRVSKLGCLIGRSGLFGGQDIYLYPACLGTAECPQLVLQDMGFLAGFGPRYEFASGMRVSNVFHLYPGDGWQVLRNGYKSRFQGVSIVAGTGRTGLTLGNEADITLIDVDVAGPICLAMDGANAVIINCEAAIQPGYRVGYLIKGMGTNVFQGGGVDAEVNAPGFLAAALVENPQALTFMGAKLYSPPGSPASPVLYQAPPAPRPSAQLNLIGCLLEASPSTPLIRTGGAHAQPVKVIGCSNSSGSEVCDVPANVVLI